MITVGDGITSDAESIELYWARGCTSCLRAKEFLERNDVPFLGHNVTDDRSHLDEMEARGLPRQVPVATCGDDWVDAQELSALASLAGVEHEASPLPVDEILARLDRILTAVSDNLRAIPSGDLDVTIPNRSRTTGALVYHVFSIPDSFLAHEAGRPLREYRPAPEWTSRDRDALVAYGVSVRERLRAWTEGSGPERNWTATADVYYGRPTVHEFLERTTWHAGQHARQLNWLLTETFDVDVDTLPENTWDGLPVPDQIWDGTE